MGIGKLIIRSGVIFVVFYLIFTDKAYAYIDPGAGSVIFQIILVVIVSGLYFVKQFFGKIKNFFRRLISKKTNMYSDDKR